MRHIFLAVEATGISSAHGDRVIEIVGVEMVNLQRTGNNKHYFINPQRHSHEEAIKCHGISDEFLLDKPLFKDIAEDLLTYCAGAEAVFYSTYFDLPFLEKELELLGKPSLNMGVDQSVFIIDIANNMFPDQSNERAALYARLGINFPEKACRNASDRALLNAEIYIKLVNLEK
jgi:DNA polymerase-3 subunit epsilon